MTDRHIVVVTAGLRQPSSTRMLADRLATASEQAVEDRGASAEMTIIELRDIAHDLTDHLLAGFTSEKLREALDTTVAADGIIAVSPIFSASFAGLFKNFFDVIEPDALAGKPVLIGATAGTARHSLALEHAMRPLFAYLRAVVAPTAVFAASEDWGAGGGVHSSLSERIDRAAGEFADLVVAYDNEGVADPYSDVTPFEQMLGSSGSTSS